MAIATARLVNSSTVSAVRSSVTAMPTSACPPNSAATTTLPTNERSMSARSACPSSNASHSATATPSSSTSKPGRRQRQPARHQPQRDDQDRIAQREEQRRDDGRPRSPGAACAACGPRTTIARQRRRCEFTPNITQCPGRSGPLDRTRERRPDEGERPPRRTIAASHRPGCARCRSAATAPAAPRTTRSPARPPDRPRAGSAVRRATPPAVGPRRARRRRRSSSGRPRPARSTGLRGSRASR